MVRRVGPIVLTSAGRRAVGAPQG
ncbi:hypothetical protein RHCRD62_10275 [Rhodococcus sp. RD6.2]|nr:hypothetical protein RHCRD62_10275 [Rhodococcus sp. RD6.2]